MSAPLTKGQKRYLSQLADRAFNRAAALARGAGEAVPTDNEPHSVAAAKYRHEQVAKACGKLGLRCADQHDYKLIEGHFLELLGQHGAAFNAQLKAHTETRRQVEHKITAACAEFGFSLSYAHKICCAQNKGRGLEEVEEKQLWQIFFTIRNRGLARRKALNQEKMQPQFA